MTSAYKTPKSRTTSPDYKASGVNTDEAEDGLNRIVKQIKSTWEFSDSPVKLDLGYFANVIDIAGLGIAICTDGIGSKALLAQMVGKYDTVGIDCVAMNVNDLICVGAKPTSLVDYIAVENANPQILEDIGIGLVEGARQAGISISGGEIAQLADIIKGYKPHLGFDLAATAIGTVPLDKVNLGSTVSADDVVIGISSSGIHSNGLSLARRAFFEIAGYKVDSYCDELGHSIGEELLKPTHIYVSEILTLLDKLDDIGALIHITGDGFLNLTRINSDVGFVIDSLPATPPLFSLIQDITKSNAMEMFHVFNMGIGFCVVVKQNFEDEVIKIIEHHGKSAQRIGYVTDEIRNSVRIEPSGIIMRR